MGTVGARPIPAGAPDRQIECANRLLAHRRGGRAARLISWRNHAAHDKI